MSRYRRPGIIYITCWSGLWLALIGYTFGKLFWFI